ncbi:MAG: hypothetical protein JXB88_15560 [Spirochaetales bacterium]|nr:hypothetical protein [Spirochaetales bacterium]
MGLSMVFFFFVLYVYGEENENPLTRFIDPEKLDVLLKEREISVIFGQGKSLTLIPEINAKEHIIKEVRELNPTAGVELLLLFKPDQDVTDKGKPLFLYNTLRSISTLKGIEYYSASRKRMRIFYHDAFVIDSPTGKKRMDDPVVTNTSQIPEKSELFAYLEDSSFGNYICQVEYAYDGQTFIMVMENFTQIWYTIIPLIKPHNLKSYIIIIPYGREILFYGFSCLRATDMFGIAKSRIQSLYNRIKALYDWFRSEYK